MAKGIVWIDKADVATKVLERIKNTGIHLLYGGDKFQVREGGRNDKKAKQIWHDCFMYSHEYCGFYDKTLDMESLIADIDHIVTNHNKEDVANANYKHLTKRTISTGKMGAMG